MIEEAILKSIEEGVTNDTLVEEIREELHKNPRTIVILDDDPTGTQTVSKVPIITQWSQAIIDKEVTESPVFFILTNSRSLRTEEAISLAELLGKRLQKAASKHRKKLVVISRGDSTLRGHYPAEVTALSKGLSLSDSKTLIAPAFFEGGRYTFEDVHYLIESNSFIPVGKSPFAKDSTFGYQSSNLKEWVEEKTNKEIRAEEVRSFSLQTLRTSSIEKISRTFDSDSKCFIANATTPRDLNALALASLKSRKNIVYRTAASFVNAITAIQTNPLLDKEAIKTGENSNGGLVIVGSYVPKTSLQLAHVQKHSNIFCIGLNIKQLLENPSVNIGLHMISQQIDSLISEGKDVLVFTGRKLITGDSKEQNLDIVNRVSQFLITIVRYLKERPNYILTKGGITSSDIAVKGLGVKKAYVIGQIDKGIPVWKLGEEAKFQNIPYIVFPGNVGDENTLQNLIQKLS